MTTVRVRQKLSISLSELETGALFVFFDDLVNGRQIVYVRGTRDSSLRIYIHRIGFSGAAHSVPANSRVVAATLETLEVSV